MRNGWPPIEDVLAHPAAPAAPAAPSPPRRCRGAEQLRQRARGGELELAVERIGAVHHLQLDELAGAGPAVPGRAPRPPSPSPGRRCAGCPGTARGPCPGPWGSAGCPAPRGRPRGAGGPRGGCRRSGSRRAPRPPPRRRRPRPGRRRRTAAGPGSRATRAAGCGRRSPGSRRGPGGLWNGEGRDLRAPPGRRAGGSGGRPARPRRGRGSPAPGSSPRGGAAR